MIDRAASPKTVSAQIVLVWLRTARQGTRRSCVRERTDRVQHCEISKPDRRMLLHLQRDFTCVHGINERVAPELKLSATRVMGWR